MKINQDGLQRFSMGLDVHAVKSKGLPPAFPLTFPNLEAEVGGDSIQICIGFNWRMQSCTDSALH